MSSASLPGHINDMLASYKCHADGASTKRERQEVVLMSSAGSPVALGNIERRAYRKP